ncbi:centrosome and spindle pole-associated protein 1-like isoform X1 [Argopecten irradians]|uniref:centrosome and spindle pole-associated protein 1-like isoform X1 n=1 Tax=Argopecten irradians TaxID=31199 RepID=UPI003713CF32
MAAAVQQRQGDDIDRFIKDQRQKLQQERRTVNDDYSETERGRRRQWDRSGNNQYAEQKKGTNVGKKNSQSPRDLYNYDVVKREMMENKRQEYQDYLQKGQPPTGRLTWDQTGHTQLPAQQGNRGKKHTVNFEDWEKGFQDDKRKDYNKFLKSKQNQGRLLKKEPTPPLEGMKFGEYEEFKREREPDRKRQYKEDLEKQKREQALIKLKRDYPNKQPLITVSPRQGEVTDRKGYQNEAEERKQKQFSKMLAQQPAVRDVRLQESQPRRRSPSPEFSDPGMQLQAERIRARIRDLPTRPEEVEALQRRQQQQDALQREIDEISPRNSYEERRPPVDLSPRLDDYGSSDRFAPPQGLSDRYPPPQEDYRQPQQLIPPSKKKDGDELVGEGISLPLSGHEGQRQQLKEAVKKEYNEMMSQKATEAADKDSKRALEGEAISLPLSAHEEKRRRMIKERQEEYNDMLAKKKLKSRPKQPPKVDGEDKSLMSQSDNQHEQGKPPERKQEHVYRTLPQKKSEESSPNPLEGEAISLPISGHAKERQKLMEERRREYNEMIGQLKSKNPYQKGTKKSNFPEEFNKSENENLSDLKQKDFTQQYDSNQKGRETTDFEKKQQELMRLLKPDPYPREQARPELLSSLPQGQYEVERERVDFDRQRQNEEMLSKLEENRIFLNRMYHPGTENPTRQSLKDAVSVQTTFNPSPVEVKVKVTPDDNDVEQVEEEQKTNTGRRLKREKDEGRPVTPGGLMNKLGMEQQQRTSKLNNQRKIEYNQLLTEKGGRPPRPSSEKGTRYTQEPRQTHGRPPRPHYDSTPTRTRARIENSQPESFSGGLPGKSAAEDEQIRRNVERNEEYNEYLRNKEDNRRSKSADRRPPLPRERERPRSRHGRNSPSQVDVPRLDLDRGAQPPTPRRNTKQSEKFQASLPGLQSNSAQRRRKEEERNREYNEMLKKQKGRGRGRGTPRDAPPETRRGWQTPTYDEILEKKRREERQYRRNEDPYGDSRGIRPYASEGAINRVGIDDVKMRDLDREYEQRRVRFQNDRSKERGILDDDNWLRTDEAKEQQYSKLVKKISGPERKDYLDSKSDSELDENYRYRGRRDRQEPEEPLSSRTKDMSRPPGDFFATLPLGKSEGTRDRGQQDRDSATRRKKQKYRDELQLQMRDKVAAKTREKREELLVAASGYLDPEKTPVRVKNLPGQPGVSPRRRIRSPEVVAYHSKIVQNQQAPRGGGYDPSGDFGLGGGVAFGADGSAPKGRRRDRGGYEPSAFLDGGGGFDTSLLEPRRPTGLSLPPGLQYQPTFGDLDPDTGIPNTYITGQENIGGLNASNSIDDAYRFYGMRNPLDPDPAVGGTAIPPLNLGGEGQGPRGGRSPRVTFDDSHRGILKDTQNSARRPARHRSPGRTTPYQFDADQEDRQTINSNKREYANDLARQMELDKLKRERLKQEDMRYEKKIEEDMLNYNPFGRSGGGAPNLDSRGQPIADLRQMRKRVDDPSYTPPPRESPRFRAPVSPKDDYIPPPPAQINAEGETTYALGGHGIFGNPRTEEEKSKADKYKDDLRLQILEKKRQDQLKKEQEKIEEEKENRRLEEQRQRIQRDFDEEQRKKREKEEENRRKQEELIRKNEEKRREAERAKREKAEIRQRDRERELDDQKRIESQQRTSSPPVPTLRSKLATSDGEPKGEDEVEARGDSPPVPAQRSQRETQPKPKARPPPDPVQRANSSEVLRELATMRQQLESERKRVEGALNKQKNEPEVFDPRLVQRPQPKEVDVFKRATEGNASVPQRVSDTANPKNIQEFQDLKYKAPEEPTAAPAAPTSEASAESKAAPPGDTESRRAFRSMFPEQPYTNTTLESQQDAMLRQQNEQIRTLKDRSYVPPNDLGMSARQGTGTPRSLLQANTAFIDVENVNHFPEDFDDMAPKRNDSARMRRRERVTPLHDLAGPSNVMGSVSSLDVDRLQRKNDARIRRLQQMNADEVSMADPDEILENFMAKQRYNRPPSGQTLQDDTWLQPGNKQL